MIIDIIIFAVIALVVAYRFYNMLGDVDDNNPTNKRKFTGNVININKDQYEVKDDANSEVKQKLDKEEENLMINLTDLGKKNLAKIKVKEQDFLLKSFISKAEKAFELIISAFCKGDKEILSNLTNKEMSQNFLQEFNRLKKLQQTLNINIVAIIKSEIKHVELNKNIARISVKFISEQITIIQDTDNNIISGNKDKIEEIDDIWVFERKLGSANQAWILAATENK